MTSIADQLPPEIAAQLHPDRRKNEAAYWAVRDQLLDRYGSQWIGFADGKVIASGNSPVAVFHTAEATGLHPFFICVGREEEPCRIRRAASVSTCVRAASRLNPFPQTVGNVERVSREPLRSMKNQSYPSLAARTRFRLACAGRVSRITSVVRTRRRPTAAA